jgi:hypothetical protein
VRRDFVPARRQEVEPAADHTGWEPPQRDLVDELAAPALGLPAAHCDRHGGDDREEVGQPIGVDVQRPYVNPLLGGLGMKMRGALLMPESLQHRHSHADRCRRGLSAATLAESQNGERKRACELHRGDRALSPPVASGL